MPAIGLDHGLEIMPGAAHTSPYDDSCDESDVTIGRVYERDTGSVPFAARACEACNAAGERAEVMASAIMSASMTAAPTVADIGKDTLLKTELAGIAASEAITTAIVSALEEPMMHGICDATKRLDRACSAALPAVNQIEGALSPYIGHIGKLLLQFDEDIQDDAKAALHLEQFCTVIIKASANVEDRMVHVSSVLGRHLARIAMWGDRQVGVAGQVPLAPRRRYV